MAPRAKESGEDPVEAWDTWNLQCPVKMQIFWL